MYSIIRSIWVGSAAAILCGCTSIQFSNYDQAVKVTSVKPGAEIRHKGELLGVTPAYVRISRHKDPEIELRYPGQPSVKYHLQTKYRWVDSFLPNLFGGLAAPVFIFLDLNTDTAWNLKAAENIEVPGRAPVLAENRKLLAIAPPQIRGMDYSDQVGMTLEDQFKVQSRFQVYPYEKTIGKFEDAHYNYDNISAGTDRGSLFADLGATHILESKRAKSNRDKLVYTVRNVFTDQIEETGEIDLPEREARSWGLVKPFFIGLIPNAITFDLSSRHYQLEKNDGSPRVSTKAESLGGWAGDLSRFAGSFSVTNLIPPGRHARFEAHIRFLSSADLNFSQFHFEGSEFSYPETKYRLGRGVLAVGPQIYLETALGVFYFDVMVGGAYSYIQWTGPYEGTVNGLSVQSILNLGFYRYLSNRVALRLFFKQISEDTSRWDQVMNRSQNTNFPFKGLSTVEAGFSLAFYLPEAGRTLRKKSN